MDSIIIANQILILGILVCIGVFATKRGIINEALKDGISRLVFKITLPLMIFTNFTALEITPELLKNGALVILFAYISMFLLMLSGRLSSGILRLNRRKSTIHILHTMFGNHVFLGFPLINALFPGGEGLFYATLFFIVSSSLMWTLGIYMLNRENNTKIGENLKHLLNPNTIAFLFGFLFMIFNINLPYLLDSPLSGLGETTNYLSMLYIGAMLAQINIRGILSRGSVFVLSFNKLLLIPFIMILLVNAASSFFHLELSHIAGSVIILQSGMPCMAIIVVLARKFRADDELATINLFVSTILSVITLPFLYYLVGLF